MPAITSQHTPSSCPLGPEEAIALCAVGGPGGAPRQEHSSEVLLGGNEPKHAPERQALF